MNTTTFSNESQQRRIFQSGESLIRLLIRHHSIYLNDFPVLTYAMNGSLGILYFFPTLSMGKNSAYSSHLLLNVSGEIPSTAATSLVLRKFFCEFAISSMLLFSKISPLFFILQIPTERFAVRLLSVSPCLPSFSLHRLFPQREQSFLL